MNLIQKTFILIALFCSSMVVAQDLQLFQQFEGRYSSLYFGNTLNLAENGNSSPCIILTESSAELNLAPSQTVVAAYLYWAGSSMTGDYDVKLNGTDVTAERFFNYLLPQTIYQYLGAYADVTDIIKTTGNGTYLFSDFDIRDGLDEYCGGLFFGNGTNFGGWAITIIYEDPSFPLNQVNVFDGFEGILGSANRLDIELTDLEVVDNSEAKIGFLSWEGDVGLANNENLSLNGVRLSNPPLNPSDNVFNGTNTFTNSDTLFNMDLDQFNIENIIQPGDEEALIELTSSADLVMINNVVTVLNTALPDATITMDTVTGGTECGNSDIDVAYTVSNTNGTDRLPPVSVRFYADNVLLEQLQTPNIINFGASESFTITLTVPTSVPADFQLRAIVDEQDVINELDDTNNEDSSPFRLLLLPEIIGLQNLELCDVVGTEVFDLTEATAQIDPSNTITYHLSEGDAQNGDNPISEIEDYENTNNPEIIWIRVSNPDCFVVESFTVEVLTCPLPDATISIDNEIFACRERDLIIEYTVYNTNGTAPLPAATAIAFYANGQLLGQSQTIGIIPEGGNELGSIEITLLDTLPDTFVLTGSVDDDGTGVGSILELNDLNNQFDRTVTFGSIPPIPNLPDLLLCDVGLNTALFDLTNQDDLVSSTAGDMITYFVTMEDAIANENGISDPVVFQNTSDPQTIYVRKENEICFAIASFLLTTENCPPVIYDGLSPNGDSKNDVFIITNLIDVYPNFNLKIYSREGNLIYEGGNADGLWDGIPNTGILQRSQLVPVGTYFYSLHLNDPSYPEPFIGDVYVNY